MLKTLALIKGLLIASVATLAVTLVATAGMTAVVVTNKEVFTPGPSPTAGLGFDPSATGERPSTPWTGASVTYQNWGKLTMPPNTKVIAVDFVNPEKNSGLYYLTFEFGIIDENETLVPLYQSGLVGPGQHLYQITLNNDGLEVGEYSGYIFMQAYRMDEFRTKVNSNEINKLRVIVV